jgi:hypothetical protein
MVMDIREEMKRWMALLVRTHSVRAAGVLDLAAASRR